MSELLQHLRRVTDDLDELQARYALVGGLAVSLRTERDHKSGKCGRVEEVARLARDVAWRLENSG